MKKVICSLVIAVFFAVPLMAQAIEKADESGSEAVVVVAQESAETPAANKSFNIYTEKMNVKNHYIPSGWMGDYGDLKFNDGWSENTHSGNSCMEIKYSARGAQGAGWAGIYWQNPANNWGSQMGGYDLSGYNKLTFWARGAKGGEVISEFKVGGMSGTYSDSDSTSIGPITLTKDWKQYNLDLKGLDLSYISGGFAFTASSQNNPEGFVIYLDDVKFE